MHVWTHDRWRFPLPEHHRFPIDKYGLLRQRVIEDGTVGEHEVHEAEPVPWSWLEAVHDPALVARMRTGELSVRELRGLGLPWSSALVERSRRSVAGTIAAARFAARAGIGMNLGGGTHHAGRAFARGYCVFNDVAVAATVLLREGEIARAAVVDCDVHQGNGTAAIFRHEPAVFTFSLHGAHNFPFRKETSDLDITFEDGAGDDEYLAALAAHLPRVLDEHRPDLVFYLGGADPYEGDRLGRLKLTIDGLRARDRMVFEACRDRRLPVAIAMSGGYARDIDAIVTIHVNTICEAVRSFL